MRVAGEWEELDHLPLSGMKMEIAYHRDPSEIGRKDRSGITVLAKAGTTYISFLKINACAIFVK